MLCLNVCELRGVLIDQVHASRRPFLKRTYKNSDPSDTRTNLGFAGRLRHFSFFPDFQHQREESPFLGGVCAFEILGKKQSG